MYKKIFIKIKINSLKELIKFVPNDFINKKQIIENKLKVNHELINEYIINFDTINNTDRNIEVQPYILLIKQLLNELINSYAKDGELINTNNKSINKYKRMINIINETLNI